jgi:hypothetical protein
MTGDSQWRLRIICHRVALLIFASSFGLCHAYGPQTPTNAGVSPCLFNEASGHFEGGCGPLFGQTPAMTLAPAQAITTGRWRDDARPISVWSGDMTDRGYPNARLELEIYSDGTGVLRTEYGWYPVSHFSSSTDSLNFELDARHEVPPNTLDAAIIRRAVEILSSTAVWNRADNRNCPANANTWSIYCALEKATGEVTGGVHHRRPALEVVREIVHDRTSNRQYDHRLMGYNNDPTTTLADVQSLFAEALRQVQASQ